MKFLLFKVQIPEFFHNLASNVQRLKKSALNSLQLT